MKVNLKEKKETKNRPPELGQDQDNHNYTIVDALQQLKKQA